MEKFTVNHVSIVEKGPQGPWAYALVSSDSPRFQNADVIELRSLPLEVFQKLAVALPTIKAGNQILSCEAEIRYEKKVESFVSKTGEARTKNVVRLYLQSDPKWSREVKLEIGEGNLSDILGDVLPRDDGDIFS